MKTTYMTTLAVLAGAAIGASGIEMLHAQQSKPLPAYVIANIDVTNPGDYAAYAQQVPPTLTAYHGRFLARGGKTESFAGDPPKRVVIIAFDNMDDLRKWRSSEAFQKLAPQREKAGKYIQVYAVEGEGEAPAAGTSTPGK